MKIILSFCLSLSFSILLSQNAFRYNEFASGLALGKGFDLLDASVPYVNDIFGSYNVVPNGQQFSEVSFYIVQENKQNSFSSNFNASMKASFLGLASVDGSYNTNESSMYNNNSLTICLRGVTDFGKFQISNPVLKQQFVDDINNPERFKQKYGEFFVSAIRKKQVIYLYMTLTNVSVEKRNQIISSLGGGVSILPFSANAKVSLNTALQDFINSKSINFSAYMFGRNMLTNLPISTICSDFYNNNDLSKNSYESLMNYMSNVFKIENSSVTEYYYSPFSQFGYMNLTYYNIFTTKVSKYVTLLRDFKNIEQKIESIENLQQFSGYPIISSTDEMYLNNALTSLRNDRDNMAQEISSCHLSACTTVSSCCNFVSNNPYNTLTASNRIGEIFNFIYNPFKGLNDYSIQKSNIQPIASFGNPPYYKIYSKQDYRFSNSNVSNLSSSNSTYYLLSNFFLTNSGNTNLSVHIEVLINGQVINTSRTIFVDPSSTPHPLCFFSWQSNDYSFADKFNSNYPSLLEVRAVIDVYNPYAPLPTLNINGGIGLIRR